MCIRDRYMGKYLLVMSRFIILTVFLVISAVYAEDHVKEFFIGLHSGIGATNFNQDILKQIDRQKYSADRINSCFRDLAGAFQAERFQGVNCFNAFFNQIARDYQSLIQTDSNFASVIEAGQQVFYSANDFQQRVQKLQQRSRKNPWAEIIEAYIQFYGSSSKNGGHQLGTIINDLHNTKANNNLPLF
eukprot:TRINITY_DN889_c0_g1_i2.p1 TRINITY_DN889_c0_g1~~TRINITY_DN889_c0_g1_i2.p1  ORF type:complete len:188 (-),score=28.21 TRINITY_DN889_c0_g1_i2:243-806(-)